ncbi:SDR family NAD(P)-dependent oxidoreductase, partial [Roseomonas rosulenta]|uniref:SDR family NAD(P)-dependent oxidoreductase n=1 Tax=Roseomonas rosulenta TaxID=2748667 RepID=UPI0018E003F4
ALAAAGHDVAINWLDDQAAAEAVAADVRAAGRRAALVQGDVGTAASCAALVQGALDQLGRIDVLVNNAGIFPRVPFLEMTEAEWDRVLDVNLKGSAFCAQAAARHMVAAGIRGVILNLSSSSVRGAVLGVHYSATKTGIIGITRSMALALAPHGIRVNAIAPGLTDTAQPRYGNTDSELAEMAKALPLGRMGRPEEIAGLMAYLASDAAEWITGQVYHINGGVYLA